tara:strand:+ start:1991 stop:2926 length:936 start_codon:yes stop_codon:yes gene_type:complete
MINLVIRAYGFFLVALFILSLPVAHADSWRLASEWAPHPRCIEALDMGDKEQIDRYDCDRLGIGLEVFNGSPDDGIFGGLTYYRPKQDDGRALGDGYYGYQRVGDLAGGLTLLRTYENPGGNAAADALILVKGLQRDPGEDIEEIVLVAKERFGNRCVSGISNVDVPSKKTFRVTLRATPFDFMVPGVRETLLSQKIRKALAAGIGDSDEKVQAADDESKSTGHPDLDWSANSCLAYMVYEASLTGKGLHVIEAHIDIPLHYWEGMSEDERCLKKLIDKRIEEHKPSFQLTLTANEYTNLKQEFFDQCWKE